MKKIVSLIIAAICTFSLVGCVDQSQERSNVSSDEVRIVATSVTVCDILSKLGLDVVGVPTTSYELPEEYKGIKEIGSPMSPDMEIVKSLNPTDVIGTKTLMNELKTQYDNIGVNSTFINLRSVTGMYKSIQDLGEKYNKEKEATELIEDFYEFIDEYQSRNIGKDSPRVLILMGLPGSYLVATENSYAGSLVKMAGATNVFKEKTTEEFVNVNTEELLKLNPDIILRTSHALPEQVAEMFAKEFETNDVWKHFTAVQNGKVYDLDNNLFGMSANFKYKDALERLQVILYGED